jgi:uncharacterized spore protein YtfJ
MANPSLEIADAVKSFGIKAVYGETLEIDGSTVLPVALITYGFGAGSDSGDDAAAGGGGGGSTIPVGAYIGTGGVVRFQPNLIALLGVGIPFVWVAGKALARIIRALKK